MSTEKISIRLLELRNIKGFSQQKFSEILGIGRSFLSEIESQKTLPGQKLFSSLCKLMDININWVLTGEGSMYIENKPQKIEDGLTTGERLKKIRKTLKLTQDEFAKKIYSTHGFVSSVENSRFTMGAEFLYELNRQFNVNINWLLAGVGTMFLMPDKLLNKDRNNNDDVQSETDLLSEINNSFSPKQLDILKKIINAEISKNNRQVTDEELKLLDELKTEAYLKPMLDMIRDLSIEERKLFYDIILEQKRQSALGSNRAKDEIDKKSA